jgi:hypothetical protein
VKPCFGGGPPFSALSPATPLARWLPTLDPQMLPKLPAEIGNGMTEVSMRHRQGVVRQ